MKPKKRCEFLVTSTKRPESPVKYFISCKTKGVVYIYARMCMWPAVCGPHYEYSIVSWAGELGEHFILYLHFYWVW